MALLDVLTRPPQLPRAVERPRLGALLAEGDEPACLLVAPPGSGKTVAAAQRMAGASRDGARTGWCRVAPGAAGGDDLVRLAATALGMAPPDPGISPLERAAALLDVLGEGPAVLVIDDYDQARPEECDAVLAEVLALAPPGCRLVVAAADRPAGLLGRASVGHARVVGLDDLAFTPDEVRALLAAHGHDPDRAAEIHAASAGWATAVAVLAEGRSGDLAAAVEALLDRAARGEGAEDVLAVVALVPAIHPAQLRSLDLDPQRLADLAASSALLRPVGDGWALLDAVRRPLQDRLGPDRLGAVARRVAPVLAATDPVAAADLLLDVGDPVGAADLLAQRASAASPDAVLPLLYRMPAEVRHRLPPLLSSARATVEMDAALSGAEQRLATARDPRERAEAQVAVGTIRLHRGQLASAAAILESALRGAGGGGPAAGWLALARFWAGDVDGAAAVAADAGTVAGAGSPLLWWVAGEVALHRDDLAAVPPAVGGLRTAGWPAATHGLEARLALARGDDEAAAHVAAAGYRAAAVTGGFDLLLAAPPHAWCLARAGRWDEALAVADELQRRLGAVDTCARLQADLVAEVAAARRGDAVARARAGRAVAAVRRLGYAPVEAAARRWLRALAPAGLEVGLLGPVTVHVDGQAVLDGAWRSRKAREVLLVLALAGEAGLARDEVIEAVWPERDPVRGRTSLRTALSEVRLVLEPRRPPGEPSRFVTARGDRLVVVARTDIAEAERRRTAGDAAGAWALFRGTFAADEAYAPSLEVARRAAERLQLDVAESLVEGGAPPELLVAAAAHVVGVEPWRTDLARRVAEACRAAGDEAQARRAERLTDG